MSKYLFLFTLGPVQNFISQARKTHDLWAGSRILSELTKTAGQVFEKKAGQLIYPTRLESDSLPNRLLGEIESDSKEALQTIGNDIEDAVRKHFSQSADKAFTKACGEKASKPQGFDEQIAQHLEIRWLFYPLNDYQTAYQNINALMAAMKNTRDFAQFGNGEGEAGRNCNLDGQRNALVYRPNSDNKKPPAYLQKDAIKRHTKKLKPGEGLGAVSLCKRFYPIAENFPSTSTVALLDYLDRLQKNPQWAEKDRQLRDLFKENPEDFSEEFYFEENRTFKYLQQEGLNVSLEKIENCIEGLPTPRTSYYALLIFDGDSMGKWLSGEFLNDKSKLRIFHGVLSEKLSNFAAYARDYLDKPYGKAVYAGGDDFLGFINLASLFPVLTELRNQFAAQVAKPLQTEFDISNELSFSGGLVIVHYRTPLHIVLEKARNAEKDAKKMKAEKDAKKMKAEKDALAITVVKHSGEGNQTILPWFDQGVAMLPQLEKIMNELSSTKKPDGFSDKFVRSLAAEFASHNKKYSPLKKLFLSELRRLLKRAAPDTSDKKMRIETLYGWLSELLQACQTLHSQRSGDDNITPKALDHFLQALHIAVFLKRQIQAENSDVN